MYAFTIAHGHSRRAGFKLAVLDELERFGAQYREASEARLKAADSQDFMGVAASAGLALCPSNARSVAYLTATSMGASPGGGPAGDHMTVEGIDI